MKNKIYNFFIIFLFFAFQIFIYADINYVNPKGMTIETRYNVPNGYKRVKVEKESFAEFLRNQKLKPYGEKALYYNGKEKSNRGIYDSVIDVEIGKQNLHQCADAIMLLRAEYLYSKKEYNKIKKYLIDIKGKDVYFDSHIEIDLGMDSLDMVEFQYFLDLNYGIKEENLISKYPTLLELANYIKDNRNQERIGNLDWKEILNKDTSAKLPSSSFIAVFFKFLSFIVFKTFFRVKVKGKEKIEKVGVPLKEWDIRINYGIKTGCNEAFIIYKTLQPLPFFF